MSTLAEIIAEGKKLEAAVAAAVKVTDQVMLGADLSRLYALHGARLLAVAEAASELFRALDHVTPDWREKTCIIDENSDEVNVAWCGLENALDNPKAGQPPEAF